MLRSIQPHVSSAQSFRPVIATTPLGIHSPRISTITVTNHMQEIGVRPLYIFYVRRFFYGLVYIKYFIANNYTLKILT